MQISNLYEQINIMISWHSIIHCHSDLFFSFKKELSLNSNQIIVIF